MLRLESLVLAQASFRLEADLVVPTGAIVAILGPSGSGKSTLVNAIAGFLAPASGRILWNDRDLGPLAPGERPVSVIFQDQNLFPHLTAAENVGLGLRPSLRLKPGEPARVEETLAEVGLAGLGRRRPAELSGGQQSRVALARMVLRARPLALLDEPFAALGAALRTEMLDLVARFARSQGATVVMITHDPADARRIASHVIFLDDGRADPPAPTGDFFADPPAAFRRYSGL